MSKPNETQQSKPVIEVELAMSISVEIPAPDGHETMSVAQLMKWAEDNKEEFEEFRDAYNAMFLALAYHAKKYPESRAEFTPMIGNIPRYQIDFKELNADQ